METTSWTFHGEALYEMRHGHCAGQQYTITLDMGWLQLNIMFGIFLYRIKQISSLALAVVVFIMISSWDVSYGLQAPKVIT
jgi:hypothetical protein